MDQQQTPPATALYDGESVVLELNDGCDSLSVGSVEMTPEQARALAAELEARADEAERRSRPPREPRSVNVSQRMGHVEAGSTIIGYRAP
jgi:hypothetical protein